MKEKDEEKNCGNFFCALAWPLRKLVHPVLEEGAGCEEGTACGKSDLRPFAVKLRVKGSLKTAPGSSAKKKSRDLPSLSSIDLLFTTLVAIILANTVSSLFQPKSHARCE